MTSLTLTQQPYDLKLGERYERIVADQLTQAGLPARQLRQVFVHGLDQQYYRQVSKRCPVDHTPEGCQPHQLRRDLLRPYQIDLMLKVSKTKCRLIEVKALTPRAFEMKWIAFGKLGKYDDKKIGVHDVLLINQVTCEVWAVPPRETWEVMNLNGQDAYAVPTKNLIRLADWVDQIKTAHNL